MVRMSQVWLVVALLWLAMSVGLPARATAQSQGSSGQDKAKACNSAADSKGLKGDERKTFVQDCLNQAGKEQLNGMSQKDKMDACKSLADKKNVTGADRRSFLKDCMNKANPK